MPLSESPSCGSISSWGLQTLGEPHSECANDKAWVGLASIVGTMVNQLVCGGSWIGYARGELIGGHDDGDAVVLDLAVIVVLFQRAPLIAFVNLVEARSGEVSSLSLEKSK